MTNEMEGTCKEVAMLNLRYYPEICEVGLRKTIEKKFSQYRWSLG
jgi:hypothetical protein